MRNMRHFGSRLVKYFPTFLAGLLVAGWLVSQFVRVGAAHALAQGDALYVLTDGMLTYTYCRPKVGWDSFLVYSHDPTYRRRYIGQWRFLHSGPPDHWLNSPRFRLAIHLPIPMLLTVLLPLAIGPFVRYRFPLWSWLAFITLICCEFAFYL
jgi:hypothetical protein